MKSRKHLGGRHSKGLFSSTAKRSHPKNRIQKMVMRGGYRL